MQNHAVQKRASGFKNVTTCELIQLRCLGGCDAVNHFDFIFAMLQDSETTQKGLVNFAVPKNPGDRLCHGCPLTP